MSPLGRGFQRVQRREAAKLHVLQTTTHIGVLGKKKGAHSGAKPGYIIVGVKWKYKIMVSFGRTSAPAFFFWLVARSPAKRTLKKWLLARSLKKPEQRKNGFS
jgi:hypothetical protein